MSLKLFIIACEASGDTHGARLVEEIRKLHPDAEIRGLGGPKMAAQAVRLLEDMTQISALGFGDVVRQYFRYRKIFYNALAEVERFKPDGLVLIDSPAFNLRFAKKINKRFPVIYYISPQLWAWGGRRIHTVKRTVSKMLVILPFEAELYRKAGVPVEFVGHPLLDQVTVSADRKTLRRQFDMSAQRTAIGLLPGSRKKEITRILPIMLESAERIRSFVPDTVFYLGLTSNVDVAVYDEILARYPKLSVRRFSDRYYDRIASLDFALVTSGTATLETALIGTPFFLLYKASFSTYVLGKQLIRVPFLGLANLLAGKKIVPEFIQNNAKPASIAEEAQLLLKNTDLYNQMKMDLANVRGMLGEKGASERAAKAVVEFLEGSSAQHVEK